MFYVSHPLLYLSVTSLSYVISAPTIHTAEYVTFGGWEKSVDFPFDAASLMPYYPI